MSGLIVHEWLERRGGSENVVQQMAEAFPGSSIFTPWNNAPERFPPERTEESVLARTPLRGRKALSVPALPLMWRTAVKKDHPYDWVIASSHLFSHQVAVPGVPKLVYVHSPARYIWDPDLDRRGASVGARVASLGLRPLDRAGAQSAVSIAANSAFVRQRVRRAWRRDAVVIHPPVDVRTIQESAAEDISALSADEHEIAAALPPGFILGVSRFIPYKRLDQVIAAGASAGAPVVLAGGGSEIEPLRALAATARVPVLIVENPSSPLLRVMLRAARALVFPAVEDFGIVPVEAMAAGTPVIAIDAGGVTESVVDGLSGTFVSRFDGAAIIDALRRVDDLDPEQIALSARRFSNEEFRRNLLGWAQDFGIRP